jgi:hypothetical protein
MNRYSLQDCDCMTGADAPRLRFKGACLWRFVATLKHMRSPHSRAYLRITYHQTMFGRRSLTVSTASGAHGGKNTVMTVPAGTFPEVNGIVSLGVIIASPVIDRELSAHSIRVGASLFRVALSLQLGARPTRMSLLEPLHPEQGGPDWAELSRLSEMEHIAGGRLAVD